MSHVISFHRLAADEYRKARLWYSRKSSRTAARFVAAVNRALERVSETPDRWPAYDHLHRLYKVGKFPYLVTFRVLDQRNVAVVAVAHTARRPGYWRRRRA